MDKGVDTTGADGPPTAPGVPFCASEYVILLVEDQADVLKIEHIALERQGYRLLEASSSAAALLIGTAQPERIDLLVTDVVMPRMNGVALAAAMRQSQGGLKVLYLSGCEDRVLLSNGLVERDVALLRKPFTLGQLAAKVREVLESSSPEQV